MRLVSDQIEAKDIVTGDLVSFDYLRANGNVPSRLGIIEKVINGDNVRLKFLVWDYSLNGGATYRTYFAEDMINLCKISVDNSEKPVILSRWERYKQAIVDLKGKILG